MFFVKVKKENLGENERNYETTISFLNSLGEYSDFRHTTPHGLLAFLTYVGFFFLPTQGIFQKLYLLAAELSGEGGGE